MSSSDLPQSFELTSNCKGGVCAIEYLKRVFRQRMGQEIRGVKKVGYSNAGYQMRFMIKAHTLKDFRGPEIADSEHEKEKMAIDRLPLELLDTQLNATPIGRSKAKTGTIPDTLAAQLERSTMEDMQDIKSASGDQDRAEELVDLGATAYKKFQHTGNVRDIERAIKYWETAFALLCRMQRGRFGILSSIGCAYESRFNCLGELSDLDKAVESEVQAVSLAPDSHSMKQACLNTLGNSYRTRFRHLGKISDLSKAIGSQKQAASHTPDGHPSKPEYLNDTGSSYQTRFGRLDEVSDLNKAIKLKAQAVALTPDGHPDKPGRLNNLGISYTTRFGRLGDVADLKKAMDCQGQAVSFTPDSDPAKLICLNNLGVAYETQFGRLGKVSDLNKAIESQAQAISLTPDGHPNKPAYLNNLGSSCETRFRVLGEISDLNKATESKVQAVSLAPNGHPDKPGFLNNLGSSYETRFRRLGELSDLNKVIDCQEQAVSFTPDGHPGKPGIINNLGSSHEARFKRLGQLSDMNKAIKSHAQAVLLTPDGHPDKPSFLNNLGSSYDTRFERLGEHSDLNKNIESKAQAVSLTPNGHPDEPGRLNNLVISYQIRFERLGELSDLNNAICSQVRAVLLTPAGHANRPKCLSNLGNSLETRHRRLNNPSDAQLAMSSFSIAAQSPAGSPSIRFHACRNWARLSFLDTSSSPQVAYKYAMEFLPQLVWVGTTLVRRYELIAEVGDFAAEAASHAISVSAYDLALEWLEAGRSIVWGQITSLRTPFGQLAAYDIELANQLQEVGRRLEQAGSRTNSLAEPQSDSLDSVNKLNDHVEPALRWGNLLTKARSFPGFNDFLSSPKSSRLLRAASNGPIALINIHKSRCDALILQPSVNTICHVPLKGFSQEIVASARKHLVSLVGQRGCKKAGGKYGATANRPASLEELLRNLWLDIVQPVPSYLGFINKSSSSILPHITWCTTGLLSFLPLHAAGCYGQSRSCTFDHAISSYTPTLSALLSNRSRPTSTPCGVVAVGQVHTPGFASLPCVNDELKAIKHQAHESMYLQLEGNDATVGQVLGAMDQFSWVHMACHGTQSAADPTQSAFHLYDGPLTLATVTKQSFTNKGLAFLSACQTATGAENVPDEAVHLAAGMLMAGYPSVIATMWSIEDEDGPEVANHVYAELLRDGNIDHTKAAWALHQAVGELRAKVGAKNIARWAPFIHIGS